MSQKKTIQFEESLGKDDYGLIISKEGELKGLWMPESENEALEFIPESIVRILEGVYGMDLGDEVTMH
tara:strand:+ start:472 stop:675 length:204 start_codon:yes stop_codon:yes gene_type:complete